MTRINRATREEGFSTLEVMVAIMLVTILMLGMGMSSLTSERSSRDLEDNDLIAERARMLIDRITAQPFGLTTDGAPTSAEVESLFTMDTNISDVTLQQLALHQPDGVWTFTDATFQLPGTWTVRVDTDLNGNGIEESDGFEDSGNLLRIAVEFDGRLIYQATRANITVE